MRFFVAIFILMTQCSYANEPTALPCKVSDQTLTEEVRRIYSQLIKQKLRPSPGTPDFPANYEQLVKVSTELKAQLRREVRCRDENPGSLCAIDSDLLLNAQDWRETWSVKNTSIQRQSGFILVNVSFQSSDSKEFDNMLPVILKFNCENNELVLSDKLGKDGSSFLRNIKLELDNLKIKSATLEVPSGWRFPTTKDIVSNWKETSTTNQAPYHLSSDFNGDTIQDEAWILIRTDNTGWGLYVFLGQRNSLAKAIQLDQYKGNEPVQTIGISIASPGNYITACGKGYWDCKDSESKQVTLQYPAIDYFMYESAHSFFYWDSNTKSFNRIWISD